MKCVSTLLIILLALPLSAQSPAPASDPTVIRSTAQEVLLDLVARDKKGHLVKDLKPNEIEVSDDGVPQKIRSFRLRAAGDVIEAGAPAPSAAEKAAASAEKLNPSREIRLVTLAFDRLGSEGRKLSRQASLDVLKSEGGSNLFWAVFMMDQRLSILQQYTADKDKVVEGIDKATAASFSLYTEESDRIAKELEISSTQATAASAASPTNGPPTGGQEAMAAMAQMQLNMLQFADAADRSQQGQAQLFGLAAMIREQKRLPGRKTLLYFTGGLNIPPERNDYFKAMIADANRANVTVYCIDANGLGTYAENGSGNSMLSQAARSSASNASKRGGPVTADEAQGVDHALSAMNANGQVALEELAKDTGGFLVANTNDFKGPLRKMSEEISTYYEVTYTPTIDKYDGHFRKISVSTTRPDVRIQSRSGYFALPSMQGQDLLPYEVPMLSALAARPMPHNIMYRSSVKSFVTKTGAPQESVIFDVPMDSMTLTQDETDKTFRLHVALMGLVKDASGSIVQKISRDVNTKGQMENLEATKAGHFIYTQYMTLPPGRYTLETAVLDREANRIGAKKQVLVVSQPPKELAISSLTLVRKVAQPPKVDDPQDPFEFKGGKVTPELNETIKGGKGSNLGLYFVVYAKPGTAAKFELDFVQDGKLIAKSDLPMPTPDEAGRINYVATLPIEALKAGEYEVYAKVFQDGKGVQERLMINVEQ